MGIVELWLPILVTAIVLFVMSALVWMVLPWHKSDFRPVEDEEAVRASLKGAAPGYYMLPYCVDPAALKDEAVAQKFKDGPLAYITVVPSGMPAMGGRLIKTFLYYIVVSCICAYMVTRTVASGADYLAVFRVAGTTAFVAYGVAYFQENIWFGRSLSLTLKSLLDALIYGLLTGGVFGWLYS